MSSPKYKLTTAGKLVCVLLVIGICVAGFYVVSPWIPSLDIAKWIGSDPQDPTTKEPDNESPTLTTPDGIEGPVEDSDAVSTVDNSWTFDPAKPSDILSVYFEPESSALTRDSKYQLDKFIEQYVNTERYKIVLEANCATKIQNPSEADKAANLALANERGISVAEYVTKRGLSVLEIKSLGSENPVNDNSSFNKRVSNRRVDMKIFIQE